MNNILKPLVIGDLEIKLPIVQGAMGIRVSTFSLVAAVANCGGAGTIASVGLGFGTDENDTDFVKSSREALRREIRQAKKLSNGVIGVNNMVALANYEDLVRTTVEEKADFIASGAGLPLKLPEYTAGSPIKLIPIISSAKAAAVMIRAWKKRYNRLPDAFIVEGPLAGGHLGFSAEELTTPGSKNLETILAEVLEVVSSYEQEMHVQIPVIAAGGIFSGKDVAEFIRRGAQGVQIASRFLTTPECDVSEILKQKYIAATDEDILIIKSPVGMPGRVIRTTFIDRMLRGERAPAKCRYRCLKTCDPATTPYCISKALYEAVRGNMDEAVVFAGSNVSRITRLASVQELMDEIVEEASRELALTGSRS